MVTNTFENNISNYQREEKRLLSLQNKISTIRIASFIVALILAVYFADLPSAKGLGLVVVVFVITFAFLVKWYNRVKYARNHSGFLKKINVDEITRLEGQLSGFDSGEDFQSSNHYYANDLDIFGRNSLFQLLNRCTTVTGRKMLANWLLKPADKEDILRRQQATEELKNQLDYCQNFQAIGLHFDNEKATFEPLINWLDEPIQVRSNKLLMFAGYILPVISILLLIGITWFNIPFGFLLLIVVVNGFLLKRVFQYSLKITEQTSKGVSTLSAISQLIKQVEGREFSSDLLVEIKDTFSIKNIKVSQCISQLAKILDFLNGRSNMFYMTFNVLFLVDIHLISRAEKWKIDNQESVKKWFDRISEFEVLSSFAMFAHANAEYVTPKLLDKEYAFEAVAMSHPLIKPNERVGNDFEAEDKGKVMIITGSNMSGKSTFLRTVGINIVLALAGAHICAEKMSLSRMLVFTSMRTQDNLEEHISSFYAELKRIKQLLELLEESKLPVLFMLDEILKGTNSHDRHKGAVAIVKQLHKTASFGFVSTHDLELGQKAQEFDYCENYSFNSHIEGDKIIFDYKINRGICKSFNASALMRNIGIEVE